MFSNILSNQIYVDYNDPIYNYLKRMSNLGIIEYYMIGTKPHSRDYMAKLIYNIEQKKDQISLIDKLALDEYVIDYNYELNNTPYFKLLDGDNTYHLFESSEEIGSLYKRISKFTKKQEDLHFYVYQDSINSLFIDVGGLFRQEIKKSGSKVRLHNEFL